MRTRFGAALAGAIAATAASSGPLTAQADDAVVASQRRGMDVLWHAVEAQGGASTLARFTKAGVDVRVENFSVGQGAYPGDTTGAAGGSFRFHYMRDLEGRRLIAEVYRDTASAPAGRVVASPSGAFSHNVAGNQVGDIDPQFLRRALVRPVASSLDVLLEAIERAGTVRWLDEVRLDGAMCDVVTYADPIGSQITLFVDRGSGLLRKSETVESHAQFGDHVVQVAFEDYRRIGGLLVSHRLLHRVGGVLSSRATITAIAPGAEFPDSAFAKPADVPEGAAVAPNTVAPDVEVQSLGEDVYLVPNAPSGYNVMFVEQRDHVIVLEAPGTPEVTRAVVELIHATAPGKPIRYAAISHYHFDHSGGLWPYVKEGATVVTTPGNVEFVRQVARATRTLTKERHAVDSPAVETVRESRTLGNGPGRVVLYQVGPNPHVDEILVAYVPELKLLYVADVFSGSAKVRPASDQTLALVEKIEQLGLEIETVVPVHGPTTTGQDFWESVRLAREAKGTGR